MQLEYEFSVCKVSEGLFEKSPSGLKTDRKEDVHHQGKTHVARVQECVEILIVHLYSFCFGVISKVFRGKINTPLVPFQCVFAQVC